MRKPISPRAGTRYSIRAQPVPWLTICCIRPLRSASICVTTPMYSSGTSIATRSTGSFFLPVDLPRQHLRLADRELEPLAPHDLDEDRELELAATLHLPDVGARRRLHAQGDVPDELPLEPGDERARRHLVALGSGERGRVDPEGHGQGRLVDGAHRQRPRIVGIRDRLADRHLGQARRAPRSRRGRLRRRGPGRAPR